MAKTVQSIERAAAVLRLLGRSTDGQAVGELAASLQLPKGTVHGILRTLQAVGFADQDRTTGRYLIGAGLLELRSGYLDANQLRACAINWSDPLAARTGAAVRVGALRDREVVIVHHVFRPDDSPQVLEVGQRLPAHATALGKALLAFDPMAASSVDRGPLAVFGPRTICDASVLTAELGRIRSRGWAYDLEECGAGTAGLAAPIQDHGGLVVGAVGIAGHPRELFLSDRQPRPELVTQVVRTAQAVSREVGGRRS